MFPASTRAGGMCMAFPDVLKVPIPAPPGFTPTPFPNIAQCAMAMPPTCSLKVKIGNMPVVTKQSQIPLSSGGEAGVMGGVTAPNFLGACSFKQGSMKVKVEGNPVVTQLAVTGQNGTPDNAPGGAQIAPSQVQVIVT
jgi:hypothetical protein